MAAKLTLALGGIRSGKSAFAESLVRSLNQSTMYIATGQASDPEMTERIRRHRESRPPEWATLEAPLELADGAEMALSLPGAPAVALIDSLDGWLSNLMLAHEQEDFATIESLALFTVNRLVNLPQRFPVNLALVSSEVGLTLVSPNSLGRQFQDLLGLINQRVAAAADQVFMVVAGVPMKIK